jgi:ABC-2 type transport system ATP-binding protein
VDATIDVSGLRKRFGGTVALDGMTFSVRPGQVTGFVGPNGAGKSTTMRVILGLDAAEEGEALVGGQPYRSLRRPLSQVGSLLDAGALQPSRRARNHLLWLAHSQGLTAQRVDQVIEQAGLQGVARRKAGGFSLGMRQRLGLAAAMLGDPVILMLDEPFNGLDPEGIVWMRGFLRGLAAQGRAVLVSSHLMSELQDTADHLVIVGRGKVIADTSMAALLATASAGRVRLRTDMPQQAAAALRAAGASVTVAEAAMVTTAGTDPMITGGIDPLAAGGAEPFTVGRADTLTVSGLAAGDVVRVLSERGVRFSEVAEHRASLEEAYMELTREAVEFRAEPAGIASGEAGR